MKHSWLRTSLWALLVTLSFSIKPEFFEEPQDKIVLQGEDVTLRCVVEYLPSKDLTPVQWTRGDFALGYDRNLSDWERYSMVGDFSIGEYHLHIKNVNAIEDENQYECQVTGYMLRTKKATLTVNVPPVGPFVDGRENGKVTVVDVVVGKQNSVTCRAVGGKPAANLHWYRNGIEIFDDVTSAVSGPRSKLYNTSATLRITPTSSDADATYACVMTSDALESDQFGRKLVKLNMLKPPIVSVALPSSIVEGDYVTAECRAVADPPVLSYRWYVNGREQTGEVSSTFDLGVVNSSWHSKTIACEAKNDGGYSERNEAKINVLYTPVFVGGSNQVTAEIGDNVTLWCEWDSNPRPTIHWIREGDAAFVWTSAKLELLNVDQSDAGRYICHANAGNIGSSRATSLLMVRGPPIIKPDTTQYAALDKDAVIHCDLLSYPGINQVTWTWSHDETDFTLLGNQSKTASGFEESDEDSIKYRGYFSNGGQSAQLRIKAAAKGDLHSYSCSVTNSYGKNSMTIILEEDAAIADDHAVIGIIVGVALGLILLFLLLLCWCCARSRKQRKSTNFDKQLEKNGEKGCMKEEAVPIHLVKSVGDDEEYNVRESLSSRSGAPASTVSGSDDTNPTPISGHDDGYHTEGANSWNRSDHVGAGKVSVGLTTPAKSAFPTSGHFVDLPPPSESIEHKQPLFSHQSPSGDTYVEYPPRPMSVNRHPYNQSSYDPTAFSQPVSTLRSASALGERMSPPHVRYMHRNYSDVAALPAASRYQPAPDYFPQNSRSYIPMQVVGDPAPRLESPSYPHSPSIAAAGRATDRYLQMPPLGSSQSSLDKFERESALSASAVAARVIDPQENPSGRRSNLSRSSQSSEFVRPLIARMATHV